MRSIIVKDLFDEWHLNLCSLQCCTDLKVAIKEEVEEAKKMLEEVDANHWLVLREKALMTLL
jgi:hypothetical protein